MMPHHNLPDFTFPVLDPETVALITVEHGIVNRQTTAQHLSTGEVLIREQSVVLSEPNECWTHEVVIQQQTLPGLVAFLRAATRADQHE